MGCRLGNETQGGNTVKTRQKVVVLITVLGLLAISGIAMAAEHFDENDDTVFNIGADTGPEDEAFLFWNITSLEFGDDDFADLYDSCALEGEGPFTYVFDGEVLQLDGYTDDGTCGPLQGGDVTADGHPLNHGAYMSFFNSTYEGTGRGCLNSTLAHSGLGKDSDDAGPVEPDDQIDFQTVVADCQHGKKSDEGQIEGQSVGNGRGNNGTHGKSGDAPGHNK